MQSLYDVELSPENFLSFFRLVLLFIFNFAKSSIRHFVDMKVSLEALKITNRKRAMAKGGASKAKNAMAKKPRVGPSLEGPSASTMLAPKQWKALVAMDDYDMVVNLEPTLTALTISLVPAPSTIALAPVTALSSAIISWRPSPST